MYLDSSPLLGGLAMPVGSGTVKLFVEAGALDVPTLHYVGRENHHRQRQGQDRIGKKRPFQGPFI